MKFRSTNSCPIIVYSELNLIHEILSQVYEKRIIEQRPLSRFQLQHSPSIIVIDLIGQINLTEDKIKSYLKFQALCFTIILLSNAVKLNLPFIIPAPFKYTELTAAIDKQASDHIICIHSGVYLNDRTSVLIKASNNQLNEIKLTRIECDILKCLAQAAQTGAVASEQTLLKIVFGYHPSACTNTVRTHIYRLRQKIGKSIIESSQDGYYLPMES